MTDRVLVTCPPMLGLIDRFRPRFEAAGVELDAVPVVQTLSEAELIERLPTYDGWIAGDDPANGRTLGAGVQGRLRAVVKWGVGVDNVDFKAAEALGLKVVNTPQVFGREVADVAMAYVLGLARETYRIDREIRLNNAWPKPPGISTWDKTVALVGFGDIGRQTARRLLACDMKVIAYDPFYAADPAIPVESATWPERLEEADFLVFTCPLNDSTLHMFNETILPRLKPGVRVVNVARGPIIDERALLQGLDSGLIHSVGLDVFEDEPLAPDNPLRAYDRAIFGSHNGSNTADAVVRVSELAIDKLFGLMGDFGMSGEAVIVTGAAGGIGQALIEVFEARGIHAIGLGRRSVNGLIGCDLAELGRTGALPDAVKAEIDARLQGRRLRALINNAAIQHLGRTEDLSWDQWQETLAVNLSAPFALARIFLDRLEADGGVILNIGSVHAQATKPEFAAYGTSKAALHGLTRALAVDLGPRVRVCGLAPAAVDTPMLRAGFEGNPDGFAALEAVHPVGRIARPAEVAEAAVWMTGPEAGFLAGTNVYLDGGVLSRLHDPA